MVKYCCESCYISRIGAKVKDRICTFPSTKEKSQGDNKKKQSHREIDDSAEFMYYLRRYRELAGNYEIKEFDFLYSFWYREEPDKDKQNSNHQPQNLKISNSKIIVSGYEVKKYRTCTNQ